MYGNEGMETATNMKANIRRMRNQGKEYSLGAVGMCTRGVTRRI